MRLGFVSAILPEVALDRVLGFAREAGYSCVELMCWPRGKAERRYAGVTHLDVADLNFRADALVLFGAGKVERDAVGHVARFVDRTQVAAVKVVRTGRVTHNVEEVPCHSERLRISTHAF